MYFATLCRKINYMIYSKIHDAWTQKVNLLLACRSFFTYNSTGLV